MWILKQITYTAHLSTFRSLKARMKDVFFFKNETKRKTGDHTTDNDAGRKTQYGHGGGLLIV